MAMDRREERRLIESAAAGSRECSAALIRAHQGSLYGYILRMCGRPDVAEDIVQEAFIRVLANLDRFDPRYRFSTWLFTIGRRLYLNHAQKMRPRLDGETVERAEGGWQDPGSPIASREAQGLQRDALQRALLRLTTEQREALVLFHQQEWPIALIAQHLDMPVGTVKSHLHRGRRRLRALLLEEEQLTSAIASEFLTPALEEGTP